MPGSPQVGMTADAKGHLRRSGKRWETHTEPADPGSSKCKCLVRARTLLACELARRIDNAAPHLLDALQE